MYQNENQPLNPGLMAFIAFPYGIQNNRIPYFSSNRSAQQSHSPTPAPKDDKDEIIPAHIEAIVKIENASPPPPEPQIRTRRCREVKRLQQQRRRAAPAAAQHLSKPKRAAAAKKQQPTSQQQPPPTNAKEECLLDNEVASINEITSGGNRRYPKPADDGVRGVSAGGNTAAEKLQEAVANRSKSENDVATSATSLPLVSNRKPADSDEAASISGESSASSSGSAEKIEESPEERAMKENVLRQLGLESWERVKARKEKREQQSSGMLKIRITKEREREGAQQAKKRSRSPLKMVLKQQGRGEGEESFDFYTIQKEVRGRVNSCETISVCSEGFSVNKGVVFCFCVAVRNDEWLRR